jgi:ketosteroid isomerase-like protein
LVAKPIDFEGALARVRPMRNLIVVTVLGLAGCASTLPPQQSVTPAPVIGAERAFAARAHEIGWIPAFCEYSAADSQLVGRAGLVNAHERMCALPDDGGRDLYWAPAFAGIARSGDFGFTTGPASSDAAHTPAIQYFTVWRRQGDGTWKWIFDGGPGPVASPGPYTEDVAPLAVASRGVGSAELAEQQVTALEAGAANTAALAQYLAPEAHVYRRGQARAFGGAAAQAALSTPAAEVSTHLVRAEGSSGGDLVFTLGEARWQDAAGAKQGFFARIWQYREGGWRIVYDQLIPWSPPAAQ